MEVYKKNYPVYLLAFLWIFFIFLFVFFDWEINHDTGVFVFGGIMTAFGIICILLEFFTGKRIYLIQNTTDTVIINYKIGKHKNTLYLNKSEIEQILFDFIIKASSKSKAGFYNYICMNIKIKLNDGQEFSLEDDYVLNGLAWHCGKNLQQIVSVKHIINMFKDFDKFSYTIKNVHKIYDKRYEPSEIMNL